MTNYRPRFQVIDCAISAITLQQAVAIIASWVHERQKYYVNVCTTHTLLECHDSPELAAIVNNAGLATPDGMPLVWIGKLNGLSVERVYGPDLMLALCDYGQDHGYRHFFYGGAAGVAPALAKQLSTRFPRMITAGWHTPPFRPLPITPDPNEADHINQTQPDIVWVGLGTPKQDYWVAHYRPLLQAPALIAVGAAFDFHTGRIRQAPPWMQRSGLEWLFRLSQDPKRLWKRYLLGNPRFICLVAHQLLRSKQIPLF